MAETVRIALIQGPNLGLLGGREPDVYGTDTLDDINGAVQSLGSELGVEVETFQSNSEGALLDYLEEASQRVEGFLINPGGLTHTSVALRDGLVAVGLPFVEVHLSNTTARESFRQHSYLSPVAAGVVLGFGSQGYLLALRGLVARIKGE